jgi:hypothetical protein
VRKILKPVTPMKTAKSPHPFFTPMPADLDLVSRALPNHGFTVLSAKLGYKPKNPIDPFHIPQC